MANIDKIPEKFRLRVLRGLNKKCCYAEYNATISGYNIVVGFFSNRIRIGFERLVLISDLMRFLLMANHLDAYLLNEKILLMKN